MSSFSHSWPSFHLWQVVKSSFAHRVWGSDFRCGPNSSTAELYWQICGCLVTILNPTNLYEIINWGCYTDAYCNCSTGLDCYVISPSYIVFVSILADEFPFWVYTEYFRRRPSRRKEVFIVLDSLCSYNDTVNRSVYVVVFFVLGDFPAPDPPRLHLYLTPRLSRMLAKHNIKSVSPITRENSAVPSTCQGWFGNKNVGYIKYPMWMWPGLDWRRLWICSN